MVASEVVGLNTANMCSREVRLAAAVAEKRRMSADAARLFTEGGPGEVVIADCTQLEPAGLATALQDCATPRCLNPLARDDAERATTACS